MTKVSLNRNIQAVSSFNAGEFDEVGTRVKFGQAGYLAPYKWDLSVTEQTETAGDVVTVRHTYSLNLYANNATSSFTAKYAFPFPARMSDYDYGYGFAGLIEECPNAILTAIGELVGVNLVDVKTEKGK